MKDKETHKQINKLHERLGREMTTFQTRTHRGGFSLCSCRTVNEADQTNKALCACIFISVTRPTQRWTDKHRAPSLGTNSLSLATPRALTPTSHCHPTIRLAPTITHHAHEPKYRESNPVQRSEAEIRAGVKKGGPWWRFIAWGGWIKGTTLCQSAQRTRRWTLFSVGNQTGKSNRDSSLCRGQMENL